jgi:cytidyltransferase-like protein
LRFLEEASKFGELTVLLWADETLLEQTGKAPKFPLVERLYFLEAVRYVTRVIPISDLADLNKLPDGNDFHPQIWADLENNSTQVRQSFCQKNGLEYRVLRAEQLDGFPEPSPSPAGPGRKKIIVTGSFDWFHSGHVRFLEEVSAFGELYVIVGHDANIRLLKGEGHPLLPEAERRYVLGSIKYVKQALISSGDGWLDADPEIKKLQPDIYAVNEDGDKGGKREYCAENGLNIWF